MEFAKKASRIEQLAAEQEAAQIGKFKGRLLWQYNEYIFPGQADLVPRSSVVTDFLRPICAGDTVSLEGLMKGLEHVKVDAPVRWADMGGGKGFAMRELASTLSLDSGLEMMNVDLFDWQPTTEEVEYLEDNMPGVTSEQSAPLYVEADIETMSFEKPLDIITSVEVIQYLNDPLRSIANWYNQLADNGFLIVSAEHNVPGRIGYGSESLRGNYDTHPMNDFLHILSAAQVPFAVTAEPDWESGVRPKPSFDYFKTLAIQRRAHTKMVVNSKVNEVVKNTSHFKAIYYDDMASDTRPIIEVTSR